MSRSGGGGCGSALAMLVIISLVIAGVVAVSPTLGFDNIRRTVVPDPLHGVPGSGGEGYSFMVLAPDGDPVTWGCDRPVEIVVNPQGAPEGYADLVAGAVARVEEAGGFDLEVVGTTDDRDFVDREPGPVLLGWADETEVPELAGRTAGLGGSVYATGPAGDGRAVGGMVVIDTDLPRGWFRGVDEQAIIAHELLHVLGLGHTEREGELMMAETSGQSEIGPGDRAGLAALQEAACG